MDKLQLPNGLRILETQVAGHAFQTDTEAFGLLQDQAMGCVYKPLGKPACGERECSFYESIQNAKDPLLLQLQTLVPRFYHKIKLAVNQREHMFLKLEDLTYGMLKPCIIDIKIGKRTWDPVATPQKRAVEEEKYAECKNALGLCVPGFQVYQSKTTESELLRHGKNYGKKLNAAGFRSTIAFFLNTQPTVCDALIKEILSQLYAIRNWFKIQTLLHFYASSLLIAYDFQAMQTHLKKCSSNHVSVKHLVNGSPLRNNDDHPHQCDQPAPSHYQSKPSIQDSESSLSLPDPKHWVKVKMIDFAHVFSAEDNTLDTNYLFGLENLITVIEELLVQ